MLPAPRRPTPTQLDWDRYALYALDTYENFAPFQEFSLRCHIYIKDALPRILCIREPPGSACNEPEGPIWEPSPKTKLRFFPLPRLVSAQKVTFEVGTNDHETRFLADLAPDFSCDFLFSDLSCTPVQRARDFWAAFSRRHDERWFFFDLHYTLVQRAPDFWAAFSRRGRHDKRWFFLICTESLCREPETFIGLRFPDDTMTADFF